MHNDVAGRLHRAAEEAVAEKSMVVSNNRRQQQQGGRSGGIGSGGGGSGSGRGAATASPHSAHPSQLPVRGGGGGGGGRSPPILSQTAAAQRKVDRAKGKAEQAKRAEIQAYLDAGGSAPGGGGGAGGAAMNAGKAALERQSKVKVGGVKAFSLGALDYSDDDQSYTEDDPSSYSAADGY